MKAIHVRNLPDDVVAALKRRAAHHRRSLQKEVEEILALAARDAPRVTPLPPIAGELVMADVPASSGTWSREEIYGDDGR
jgi:hypothetical protein